MLLAIITAVALSLQAGPVPPSGPAAAASPPAAAASLTADDQKIVCVGEEETGSRLGAHKTCLTKLQWRERQREGGDALTQIQHSSAQHFTPG